MKVEILDEAERDMIEGFRFYEAQAGGLGDYFLDSLYADIDSLRLYEASTRCTPGSTGYCPKGFPSPSTTRLTPMWPASMPSWIAVATRRGFKNG